ncbi:XdhC family protein [Robertmurraya beringensis]|uniref:XdhC family protein n=1 Tax=Robertmurraya beringensis TaxID=641660 RepID=A0ABV6KTY2_9BACI
MEAIHDILQKISTSNEGVLATIIRVEGSAYRKEGTSMLFHQNGSRTGILSAGCLETDLELRVKEWFGTSEPQTIVYHMQAEDDLSWGQGAGCNGIITVLLEPIDDQLLEHLIILKNHLELGNRVTMIKQLDEHLSASSCLFMTDDGTIFGSWTGSNILSAKSLLKNYHLMPQKSGTLFSTELASNIYTHTFEPKPRLMIFGAGEDVIPLVDLANKTGFSVIVSDWRPALCNKEVFPKADQLIVGFPMESLEKLTFFPTDSAIVVSHNFQRDKEYLQYLLTKEIRYLGVLGSKNRTQRLLEGNIIPPHVKSPIGLSIGAEGPEEIAVSIVAELIQQQRKKSKEGITYEKWNHRHISCCG